MRVFRWWIHWLRFNLSYYRYMRFSKYLLDTTSFLIIVGLLSYGWTHTICIRFIFIYVFNKLSNMNSTLMVRLVGGVEKWEDRKDLVFPHVYLVEGVEKWEGGKLFCLVGEKNGRMENVVYINWLLCHCYISTHSRCGICAKC